MEGRRRRRTRSDSGSRCVQCCCVSRAATCSLTPCLTLCGHCTAWFTLPCWRQTVRPACTTWRTMQAAPWRLSQHCVLYPCSTKGGENPVLSFCHELVARPILSYPLISVAVSAAVFGGSHYIETPPFPLSYLLWPSQSRCWTLPNIKCLLLKSYCRDRQNCSFYKPLFSHVYTCLHAWGLSQQYS